MYRHPSLADQEESPIAIWEVRENLDDLIGACGLGEATAAEEERRVHTDIPVREHSIFPETRQTAVLCLNT